VVVLVEVSQVVSVDLVVFQVVLYVVVVLTDVL
jgi:hypothetical protein